MILSNVLLSSVLLAFIFYVIETVLVWGFCDRFLHLQVVIFIFLNMFIIISGISAILIVFVK